MNLRKTYYWIHPVKLKKKYNHFICLIVYAYVWYAFLIARVICNVALGILW